MKTGLLGSTNLARTALFAIFMILLILPVMILLNLHRGLDVSDTAFYHMSLAEREQMDSLTTQFGVVWGLLPFEENILFLRWVNYIALISSGAYAFISAFKVFEIDEAPNTKFLIFLGLFGAGSTSLYYIFWLPGPSYNSLALALNLGLIGTAAALVHRLRNKRSIFIITMSSGAMIIALTLTRAPTALFTGVSLCTFVLALARPSFRTTFKIIGASMLGGTIFLLLTSVLVEPFWITFERILAGAKLTNDIGFTPPLGLKSKILYQHAIKNWRADWLFILLASLVGIADLNLKTAKIRKLLRISSLVLAVIGVGRIIWPTLMTIASDINVTVVDVSKTAASVLGASFLIALLRFDSSSEKGDRRNAAVLCLLILALTAISVGQVFGSNNNWFQFSGAFPVFSILALTLALCAGRAQRGVNYRFGILCLVGLPLQFAVWKAASEVPYRLPGELNEQVVRTEIRGGKSVLWLDMTTHDFLGELDSLRPKIDALSERPILINLTGGTPMVAYHLDLDVPGTPWMLGGYKWSDEFLRYHIDQIDPVKLCKAWIVIAENSPKALPLKSLSDKGIDLTNGYTVHSITRAPYLNMPIEIFTPDISQNACPSVLANKAQTK